MQFKAEHSIWHSCQLITLKRGNSSNSFDFKEVYSLYLQKVFNIRAPSQIILLSLPPE